MTETDLLTRSDAVESAAPPKSSRSRGSGLNGMVLTELRQLAGELGIKGTSGMRKGDLVAAISARQTGNKPAGPEAATSDEKASGANSAPTQVGTDAPDVRDGDASVNSGVSADRSGRVAADSSTSVTSEQSRESGSQGARTRKVSRSESLAEAKRPDAERPNTDGTAAERPNTDRPNTDGTAAERPSSDGSRRESSRSGRGGRDNSARDGRNRDSGTGNRGESSNETRTDNSQRSDNANNRGGDNRADSREDDNDGGGRGRRGRRFRERRRGRDGSTNNNEPQISEDDVLQPVAGILDVLDNYAFVRTSGYLAGQNDVYVSMNLVRKNGLRRGDAITGAVKLPRDGENTNQRQKFNPLVRLDSVNGAEVEAAKKRPDFGKLTPLYPNERLRLETTPERLSTRVMDLIMPIGKGQRALIVSPPKAGKTTVLQDIANAITTNNPECHLMVVLVDERPEEVTDMQRSVKGEVIASTFDRPPSDHTSVAELAIERAKRLVEQGADVVVLLDSITRLGRAYNNASPASGRILSGGVDSTALYPPKRFLGAARNIENGGSLTIIASALVETGSTGDTVIYEEFKGTGNAELHLSRKLSERRVFPAVDVNASSTRKDELMMSADEFAIMHKLRRLLSGLDPQQSIDLLISQLRKSKTNIEFLMQVQKNAPGTMSED